MLCMEKLIETMEKSIETMDTLGKSMNTMKKTDYNRGKIDEQCKWQILASTFRKVDVFAPTWRK